MEAAYLIMSCIGGFVLLIFLGMEKGRGANEDWVSSDLFSYLGLEQWFGEGRGTRPPPPTRGGSGMVRGFRRGGGERGGGGREGGLASD